MKKTTLSLFLLFAGIAAFSQEKLLHFGASASGKSTTLHFTDSRLGEGERTLSFAVTGHVFYDISPKFQLVSGLGFHQYKLAFKDYSITLGCDHDGQGGVLIFNSWWEENYTLGYLGIPVEGRLKLAGQESHLFLQFGLEGLFKIKSDEKVYLLECGTNKLKITSKGVLDEQRNKLLLLKAGIGYEFPVAKEVKLFLFPIFEYSPTAIFKDREVNSRMWNLGLTGGVKF